jgi:hypothetical protein
MVKVHRAVILLGLLLAAVGALLGALGSPPVAAASIVVAGALAVVAGLWLRRRTRRPRADEPKATPDAESDKATVDEPAGTLPAPARPPEDLQPRDRLAIREAELARETELDAIAEGLRSLKGSQLDPGLFTEWKTRIETWVEVDLRARADRGEQVTQQAAEWMRDFGDIPSKDWRRHLLRHLRRLGYRNYQEGEW